MRPPGAINRKIIQLSKNKKLGDSLPNYTLKTAKPRRCLSCGKDISMQHANSKFCSAKYVGEQAAHQCRNSDSNDRNNFKRKVNKIVSKGVLFDIAPFCVGKKRKRSA